MKNQSLLVPRFPSIQSPRINHQVLTKSNLNLAKSYYKDENERTGFRKFQNEQHTEINFIHQQQSQGTEITIELSKKQQLNQHSKEQLIQFIESYYGQGNLKIILKLSFMLGEKQLRLDKQQFNLLKMSMNQITISEEDKLQQQRIYQFKGQSENEIKPLIEMIIYSYNYFPQFKQQISDVSGEIIINYEGCYFQIPPPQLRQTLAYDFDLQFDTFSQILDNIMILQIECSSKAEALTKFNIVKNKDIQQLIEKHLNFTILDVVKLDLESLNKYFGMKSDFNCLQKHDQIYCLVQRDGRSIQESQYQLNEYLKSKDIIKKEIWTESLIYYDLPCGDEENEIKINCLKRQYPEINIDITNCQPLEDQKLKLQITLTTFLNNNQTKTEFLIQCKKIKTQIEEIYLPYKMISISQKQKIILENYLQEYFSKYQSCFIVHEKGEAIEIALKTNSDKWRELEKQLNEKLRNYNCQNIKLEAKSLVITQLRNCQYKNKLFKQVFQKLLIQFENQINVNIKEVDDKNIIFQVIYDKRNCDLQKIEEILQTEFISNLIVNKQDILYEESLKYFKIQAPDLISNNNIYVHQATQNEAVFLGLKRHLHEIKEFLKNLKEKYQNSWINKQEFIVQNKLIFTCLQQKSEFKEIALRLGTKIEFQQATKLNQNKIIISGFQNEVVNLLKQLSEIENTIKQYIKITTPKFNNQQIQQLISKSKQFSQIEKQTSSYFEFQKIISFQPQQSILEKLTFEGKELSIVKGDITQIQCEAIVYQILNDKCELGEIGLQNQQVKHLLKMTDNHIKGFFKEIMKDKYCLIPGELYYYKVDTKCHVDHIFNIYPPTYRQAKTLPRDQKIIEQLIKNVFKMAQEKNIKQIAFPVISAEIFGFYFNMASQILFKTIIECLFQEDCTIEQIFILENDDSRCKRLLQSLNNLVSQNSQQRTENYLKQQWQWFEQDHFEDYDDYEVNRKICNMYTLFEKGQDQQFKIFYPYSKYPGTHLIDLDQNKIWDKTHNNSEQTIIYIDNFGERKYYIDGKQVADDLNRYLIQQEIQGKRKFDIFYKFYEIYLTSKGHYQKNLQFQNIRPIQFIPYEHPNMDNLVVIQNSQLRIERMIQATSQEDENGYNINFEINQQKQEIVDKLLIYTINDDENVPEEKLLNLLQNVRSSLNQVNIQSSNQNQEQLFQASSPSNRRINQSRREPLQQKN